MKRIPLQIRTKNVRVPFNNHPSPPIDGMLFHHLEIALHSTPSGLKLSISKRLSVCP